MKFLFIILVSLIFSPLSWAGCNGKSCGHHKGDHFKKMDLNQDKVISLDEFQKAHAKMFAAMDTDKKPGVSLEEMKTFHESKHGGKSCEKSHSKKKKGDHHHKKSEKHSH